MAVVDTGSRRVGGAVSVSWTLPASKADQQALGVARTHYCSCLKSAGPSPHCVAHALWDQALLLRRLWPERFDDDGLPEPSLPLFPDVHGNAVQKEAMVRTIVHAARCLGIATESPDGSARISGHSLRVTGAQGLTRRGLDLWTVQLLGRWGSLAVQGYIRDAHLLEASRRAASSTPVHRDLQGIISAVLEAMRSRGLTATQAVAVQLPGAVPHVARGHAPALAAAVEVAVTCRATKEWQHVRNDLSGIIHAVPRAHPAEGVLTSACGWKFDTGSTVSFFPPGALPSGTACARCIRVAFR